MKIRCNFKKGLNTLQNAIFPMECNEQSTNMYVTYKCSLNWLVFYINQCSKKSLLAGQRTCLIWVVITSWALSTLLYIKFVDWKKYSIFSKKYLVVFKHLYLKIQIYHFSRILSNSSLSHPFHLKVGQWFPRKNWLKETTIIITTQKKKNLQIKVSTVQMLLFESS